MIPPLDSRARVWVAGCRQSVGAAVVRALGRRPVVVLEDGGLDAGDPAAVARYFRRSRPTHVIVAAGEKGGIERNRTAPADLMLDNLRVATTVLPLAREHGVPRLLYLASSCVYPRDCPQPAREESLFHGPLEPTSEAYSLAKLAGIGLVRALRRQHGASFIAAIPTNLYGPGDDFDPARAHVAAALMARIDAATRSGAPSVEIWGTGRARRELMHVDDAAEACLLLLEQYDSDQPVNIGGAECVSIGELAVCLREIVGYRGELRFNTSRPDGAPEKRLDGARLRDLGWQPRIPLAAGLAETYAWFRAHVADRCESEAA